MTARTHHRTQPERGPASPLTMLATEIDDAFSERSADGPAQVLRVVAKPDRPEQIELGLLPLEPNEHPADAMAGFTAPADWLAIGVVSTGRSHQLEPRGGGGRGSRSGEPIRLTFLLDRSGAAVSLLTVIGSAATSRRELHEPPDGLLADACRRVLQLPTAPPAQGLEAWLAARWLDRLLTVSIAEPGAVASWNAAVALHPLVSAGDQPAADELVELVAQAASQFDWDRLRLLVAQGSSPHPAVTPEVAAWMDAGCFARHVLAAELPLDLMASELEALLPKDLVATVRDTVSATGRGSNLLDWRRPPIRRTP